MNKEHGYVGMLIVFLLMLVALILWPPVFKEKEIQNASCPEQPSQSATKQTISIGGKDYKLFRTNLHLNKLIKGEGKPYFGDGDPPANASESHTITLQNIQIANNNFTVYGPARYPEVDVPDNVDVPPETVQGQKTPGYKNFYWNVPGFLMLIHLGNNGLPIEQTGLDTQHDQVTYYLVDVYRDITNTLQLPDDLFCSSNANQSFVIPSQSPSTDQKQLQLQYITFEGHDIFNVHCKPAIYLYPKIETQVNIKILTKGELSYTDPKYPVSGWDVVAFPNGRILYDNKDYPYLYYESKVPDNLIDKPTLGYTVSFEKLPDLHSTLLPSLGLSDKQTRDFKDYWEKVLPYSPYYFVGIMDQASINYIEPLEITPKPDLINRVRLYFQALDKKPSNFDSELLSSRLPSPSPDKQGFTVTEWGGMFKSDPLNNFTCSQ